MSKKLLFLISFVLLFSLVGSTSATDKFDYRVCWWSDLGPGHEANEPNNWYTMDRFWNDVDDDNDIDLLERKYYVKVHPNQVPDINCVALVGKGNARVDYPAFLHDNPPAFDPMISLGTVVVAGDVLCSGGYSLDPNKDGGGTQGAVDGNQNDSWWDPCMHHELTINGGTLNVGTPQTWEGYDTQYGYYGYFWGMWGGNCLRIGTVGWYTPLLGAGNGQGTMNMNAGTVNVGGHMELGAWEQTIGTLNMTGGTINITQGLYCPAAPWGATGRVNLSGGTINARCIFINNFYSSGSIDIAGGKFILSRGNEVEELTDYSNGIGPGGSGVVSLTAYGVGDGDIITDSNYGAAVGKRADLSIDYDVSNDGMTTVQTFLTDPNQAWNPSPPNGAGNVKGTVANIAKPVLSWSPGDNATSHEVYFDANEALVSARDESVRKQSTYALTSWTVDSDLTSLATYYWAIDENPGPTLGQTWDFTMANLSKASLPSPEDGEVDVNPVVDLSWAAGIYASTHDVYFSSDFNDVNDRLIDPCNTGATKSYDPPGNGLEFSTTYYWRVDECNTAGVPQWPGDLWSFTTDDHIDVDNFDSYADTAALGAVWSGTYDAVIEVATDPNIGGNSMMFAYRNFQRTGGSTYWGVEANATTTDLEVGTDWTASGVEALVLYFYGDAGNGQEGQYYTGYHINNDQMYVALEDGSAKVGIVKYYDTAKGYDMNGIQEASWQEWNIDLQDPCLIAVDMNNVVKVYIGFGGTEKTGQSAYGVGYKTGNYDTVWFDDIGLWPIRCVPAFTSVTDFTGDCVVDEQDFDVMAGDWLITDYNTIGYAGTLRGFLPDDDPNGPHWVPGRIGTGALEFGVGHYRADPNAAHPGSSEPPIDDDVLIPPLNLNTNKMSATCWIKRHGAQWDDTAWWGSNFHHGEFEGVGSTTCHFTVSNRVAESLGINWNNEGWSWQFDPSVPLLPNNDWAFVAIVVEPTNATIYTKPDSQPNLYSDSESPSKGVAVLAFDTPSTVASNKGRYIDGVIDDLRIFDYSLSLAEVQWLAFEGGQGTEPNLPFSWYKFDDGSGFVAEDSGGGGIVYHKVLSKANFVDPEPPYSRSVNFRDYVILANDWLKEPTWPPRP